MKFKVFLLILLSIFFIQGYKYEYHVEPLNAAANAADRNNQGVAYMEMGHLNHAIAEFRLAIALSPNAPSSAAYYNNLGIALSKIGAIDAARPCFERAIELNPVFLEYYNNLINVYVQDGSLYSRISDYQSQIANDGMNSQAYFMLGLIYRKTGENDRAVNCLKRYIALEKENVLSRAAKQMIFEIKSEK
ncbi:MAG: tetratricopeptide repeat protein [bacterium]|nr:tetratricopeptide repeat protein [bacterium]